MKTLLNSKLLLAVSIGIFFFLFQPQLAQACVIEFEIIDNKKDVYSEGDILVIKVTVTLTHKSCNVGLEKTNFTMKGLTILGTTDWEQKSSMVWTRKLKVQVTKPKGKNIVLNAHRTCDKDGGYGSLVLNFK